jgi:ribosomal 30S subunit maturation factor RimM
MPLSDDDQPVETPTAKRVCLGRIAAPHGVKGLVKILAYGEDPYLIEDLGPCYTSEDGEDRLAISLQNSMGQYILAAPRRSRARSFILIKTTCRRLRKMELSISQI